ncbi:DNA replication/repair protein RecF [Dermabacter sp. p3-SID358]|uniref:DNA replication/repair protein RecF n=1 Tax=Dermabacter sp. p3-SID358 TaxID=2916114 RepID=UPI0021A7EAEC|nr:DNA replication/repair protein RecF [Dermabacter sp. p3-SID358]MCT1866396.1 DNA replication/repair protein RecF [Dermabacter sp. p3-SID358]
MHLKALELTNYRSYAHTFLRFTPGITVFVGANGQGKTNIVEALWYLATLSSHRVAHDAALVRRGEKTAIIRAMCERAGRDVRIDMQIAPGRANEVRLHSQPLSRPREILGQVRAVMFSPEDLALVKGEPEGRRRFLDEILFEIAPRFASIKSDYDKVLRQRNHLLKQMRQMNKGRGGKHAADEIGGMDPREAAETTLAVWDEQLARRGAELMRARLHLVNRLRPHVGYSYLRVSSDEGADPNLGLGPEGRGAVSSPANIRYASSVLDGGLAAATEAETTHDEPPLPSLQQLHDALLAHIEERRDDELDRGVSLVGPHRDDLEIRLSDFPAKGYASHGESWSLALALRLGSYDLLTIEEGDIGDGEPILILDDVFSELDAHRRERLGRIIKGAAQVLITTANDADIPRSIGDDVHVVDVVKGSATVREGGPRYGNDTGAAW